MSELEPLLVPVKEARRLLGGIGNNQFWALARNGEVELVGTERKRWVTVASLHAYVARLPRRPLAAVEQKAVGP
jgi:hypothetical protein